MASSSLDLIAALQRVKQATASINNSAIDNFELAGVNPSLKHGSAALSDATVLRARALTAMGETLARHQDDILEANTLDLEISRDMAVPELVVDWLKLTPERLQKVVSIFQKLAVSGVGCVGGGPSAHISAQYRICPVGTVGFIYEAFPDLGAIAAALCICTGNALVLKGGSEASRTNQIIANLLRDTLEDVGLSAELIFPIESTEVSRQDVSRCSDIDLIIAHGRPSLVDQVVKQASVPVIPSRMGNCYLYWSASGSLDRVYQIVLDSHGGEPDAVNRIEKVLIHESHSHHAVVRLWNRLQEGGFEVVADKVLTALHNASAAEESGAVSVQEWKHAYLKNKVALCQVSDITAAIEWINTHSSGHADSIVTTDYTESQQFMHGCRSSAVYINTSPKFVRNASHADVIALGASNYKGIAGGLIGIDAMQVRQRIFHGS
ncbi:MAG: gamma-glutamyl-phosphate reductase [Cyanobacteria bacterium P01_D01_bin.105]